MTTLTKDQAYAAMYHYLDQHYDRSNSDDIGGLLSGMSLLANGEPANSAVIQEWQRAVDYALGGGKAGMLVLTPPAR